MATSNQLHIINPASGNELRLTTRDAAIKRGADTIIGDIYKDTIDPTFAIVIVKRKIESLELADIAK